MAYELSTLGRALDLLDAFRGQEGEFRSSELTARLGLPKSSVFRYLLILERRGYLTRDPLSKRFRLGPAVRQLAAMAASGPELRRRALPFARELLKTFEETVNLGVLANGWVEYALILESPHRVRMVPREGEREYMHSTALGKAILAHLPEADVLKIVKARGLPPLTSRTLRSLDALRRELKAVRTRGFALDCEENEEGGLCVGAPIFGEQNRPIAALSISAPVSRFTVGRAMRAGLLVRRVADRISREA